MIKLFLVDKVKPLKVSLILVVISLVLILVLMLSDNIALLSTGRPGGKQIDIDQQLLIEIYLYLKLPTMLSLIVIGAGLGVAGCVMQGLIQNPLADPSILGVSSSSSFFALLLLFVVPVQLLATSQSIWVMFSGALIGAFIVMSILIIFSRIIQNGKIVGILLAGVALSALFGALTVMIMNFMSLIELKTSFSWMFGSVATIDWLGFIIVIAGLIIGLAMLYPLHSKLDVLMLGFDDAEMTGVNTFGVLVQAIVGISIIIASTVTVIGPIGFIGLISPHIARELMSVNKHKSLIFNSALISINLILLAELISKHIYPPYIVPINAITAIMGAPFFLWLLWRFYGKSRI